MIVLHNATNKFKYLHFFSKSMKEKIEKIKRHSCKKDALEEFEIEQILNACKNSDETFILVTLIYSGMRVSELAHMHRSWIKWQNDIIQVPDEFEGWSPKTKQGARTIPLTESRLKEVLRSWFTLNERVAMDRSTIWRIVKRVSTRSGITRKVYPHSLRATFATKLAFMGMSEATISQTLGWADIKTASSYVKISGARAVQEFREKWRG